MEHTVTSYPIALAPRDGELLDFLGATATIKSPGWVEIDSPHGFGSPLHVHHDEDEFRDWPDVDLLVRSDTTLDVLSDREREVLRLMAEGLSDRGIADALTIGLATVYTHVQHVFTKLDLPASSSDNRRVRAVVTYLASRQG